MTPIDVFYKIALNIVNCKDRDMTFIRYDGKIRIVKIKDAYGHHEVVLSNTPGYFMLCFNDYIKEHSIHCCIFHLDDLLKLIINLKEHGFDYLLEGIVD